MDARQENKFNDSLRCQTFRELSKQQKIVEILWIQRRALTIEIQTLSVILNENIARSKEIPVIQAKIDQLRQDLTTIDNDIQVLESG